MKTLVSIVGPTASGKTALSLQVAAHFGASVISADSVQIYKGLDIGSGKVGMGERQGIPHYLIDVAEPCEEFSAGMFERAVEALLVDLFKENDVQLLVGGAGLYLKAVWEGFDEMPEVEPEIRRALNEQHSNEGLQPLLEELQKVDPQTYNEIDRQNHIRVIRALEVYRSSGKAISAFRQKNLKGEKGYQDIKVGLQWKREQLYDRIDRRVDEMLALGLENEVRGLFEANGAACKGLGSVGYRELVEHFQGKHDRDEAIRLIKRNSRRYAKRQMTWFNRFPDIHWIKSTDFQAVVDLVGQSKEGEER